MTRLLATLLLLAALAPAAGAQVDRRLADLRLATAVRLALVEDGRTRTLDVTVLARDGAVTVLGEVPPTRQATAASVARAVPGVRSLAGLATDTPAGPTVTVQPVSDRGESSPRDASGPLYHTVERGDTLFGLARRYNTTVETILALSDERSTAIRVGQRLRVR
ncbi:LysM peptidoglycan-binding domain-containing protein [Rubrivirga sp. IMCC45206]|uniref:LysM peptidoglycan-binding domain-containing protein n=1 Tax=Rubrivirga sp. IMCC45206 TaxID=3391614 RepID=UPI00398FB66D